LSAGAAKNSLQHYTWKMYWHRVPQNKSLASYLEIVQDVKIIVQHNQETNLEHQAWGLYRMAKINLRIMQSDCTGVKKIKHSMSNKLISCNMLGVVEDTQKSNMCYQGGIN